jgi:hypothetical protein
MLLRSTGTSILGVAKHARRGERIDPKRVEAVLIAQGRHPLLARVLAWGGWSAAEQLSRSDAERIGREIGVLE